MDNFSSERLSYRRFNRENAKCFAREFSDQEYIKYYIPEPFHIYCGVELEELLCSWNDGDKFFLFELLSKDSGSLLGLLTVDNFSPNRSIGESAEIGILIKKEFQGLGYAREAFSAIEKILFDIYKVHVIYATAASKNFASIRLIEASNFHYSGKKEDYFLRDGEYSDLNIYCKINKE